MKKIAPWLVICLLVSLVALQAPAQKKKPAPKPPSTQTQTQTQIPAPSPKATMFRDILLQYQGSPTNLGTLTKVGPDYFLIEEESAMTFYSLHAIQSVKVIKPEEGEETSRLEIRMLAKD